MDYKCKIMCDEDIKCKDGTPTFELYSSQYLQTIVTLIILLQKVYACLHIAVRFLECSIYS